MPCSSTVAVALVEGWEPSWFNVAETAVLVWEGVATVEGSPAKNEANINVHHLSKNVANRRENWDIHV